MINSKKIVGKFIKINFDRANAEEANNTFQLIIDSISLNDENSSNYLVVFPGYKIGNNLNVFKNLYHERPCKQEICDCFDTMFSVVE